MLARGTDLHGSLPAFRAPVNLAAARATWAVAGRKLCCNASTGQSAPQHEVVVHVPTSSSNGSSSSSSSSSSGSSSRRRRRSSRRRSRSSSTADTGDHHQQQHLVPQQEFQQQHHTRLISSAEAAADTHAPAVYNGNGGNGSNSSRRRSRSRSSIADACTQQQQQQQQQTIVLTTSPATTADTLSPTTAHGNCTAADPSISPPTPATEAAAAAAAAATSAPPQFNEFTQPVSILLIELIAPSYAVSRMVRIINDDSRITATRVAAYAAVELNPWTHQFRSLRSPDVLGLPEDCYQKINGSICQPPVQAQLLNMVQQQLEQSVEGYSSGQRCIDGVLVFAAPPSTAYSMPVWHLNIQELLNKNNNDNYLTDFNSRLSAADRILISIMETYQAIEALCATILHPVTKGPVPCSMILQNDWVNDDLQFGAGSSSSSCGVFDASSNGYSSSDNSHNADLHPQSTTTTSSSSSSSSTDFDPSSNGHSTTYNPKLQHHPPVILGLRNRLFLEPYLSGPVTHGPFHVLKHYWCSDGHLSRGVQPSVMITDVPGMSGNTCWCGKCDTHPRDLEPRDLQLHKERDSRYMVPRTLTSSNSTSSKESPKAGQQPPCTVWPESFVMTAIQTFKLHVARQLLAAAAEDADAAHVVTAAAAAAAATWATATEELAHCHSRSRDNSSEKIASLSTKPAVEKDISEIVIREGQTVSFEDRRRDLMARSIERWLWPLADSYKLKFRKKSRKAQLIDVILQHEQQETLIA